MNEDLQRVIDDLAERLGLPVAIDDPYMHLLAYTAHGGEVDPMRVQVLVGREAPPALMAWMRQFGLAKLAKATRIPANDELGFWPRVVVPIRHQGIQFGYLWIIDRHSSLTADQLALAESVASDAGEIFFRSRVVAEFRRAREGELVRDLLSDDPDVRPLAAEQLVESGMFSLRGSVIAVVMRPLMARGHEVLESDRLALAASIDRAAQLAPPREGIRLVRPDHALLIASAGTFHGKRAVTDHLHSAAAAHLLKDDRVDKAVIGIGVPSAGLVEARVSYRQALAAARVAEVIPAFGPVARYEDLGIYALLLRLGADSLAEEAVPEAVTGLIDKDDELLRTLELFLDRGGAVSDVAAELHVHRATVYQRLHRIEELSGVSLAKGEDRLVLHLGIKMARLLCLWAG